MEITEDWVLHPDRCQFCGRATYLRECWRYGDSETRRRVKLQSHHASFVPQPGIQSWPWSHLGGDSIAILSPGRGISYTVRGHGVTVTVSGQSNDVYNLARVADDVVANAIITGQVCLYHSSTAGGACESTSEPEDTVKRATDY